MDLRSRAVWRCGDKVQGYHEVDCWVYCQVLKVVSSLGGDLFHGTDQVFKESWVMRNQWRMKIHFLVMYWSRMKNVGCSGEKIRELLLLWSWEKRLSTTKRTRVNTSTTHTLLYIRSDHCLGLEPLRVQNHIKENNRIILNLCSVDLEIIEEKEAWNRSIQDLLLYLKLQ